MAELVRYSIRDGVAIVTIDNPPVNALSPGVPEGIVAAVDAGNLDPAVAAIVVIGAGSTFIAGADIREFGKMMSGEAPRIDLPSKLLRIENSAKPVVMAIHGTAFGGGLETAMAGHYRVIAPGAQVGQPEVKLGLIPGAAGSQRLPRLAGVATALQMCWEGEPITAKAAVECGIADRIIEGDLLSGAIDFAKEVSGKPIPRTRERNEKLADIDPLLFALAREAAKKARRGQTAPLAAIDAIEAAVSLTFDEGCAHEARLFDECLFGNQSKALIHAFFGERTVGKIPGIGKDTPILEIKSAAIVGAGTMGGGIAMAYANAGIPVFMKETSQEALEKGMAAIRRSYAGSVNKGRLSEAAMAQRMALIRPQLTYEGFDRVDIVIEAVFEGMALKKQIFGAIDAVARPGCILATNTSTLDIDEIAAATGRPEWVVGHHFFSPANVMRLLEVVRGKATSDAVISTSMALGRKLKKVAVLAGNCRGFIGNRMLLPYQEQAEFLLEEGASVEEVNQTLTDFGWAMGPLAVADLSGLDVFWRIREEFRHLEKPGVRVPRVAGALYEKGCYGQKTGAGFSRYDQNRNPSPNPDVARLAEEIATTHGIPQRGIAKEEILERCMYALINEGAQLLEEGIALRAVDIDIVWLTGYGFPSWRGGPMFYADTVGLDLILGRILEFGWTPAPLLRKLAGSGGKFNQPG